MIRLKRDMGMFILIFIFLIPISMAFECDYETEPLLKDKITWFCYDENLTDDYSCVSYVDVNGSIVQTNPVMDYNILEKIYKEYEFEDTFESGNGLVNIYFTDYHLLPDVAFNFNVLCVSDNGTEMTFSAGVKPRYSNLEGIVQREQYFKENIWYIVLFITVGLGLVMLLVWIIKPHISIRIPFAPKIRFK